MSVCKSPRRSSFTTWIARRGSRNTSASDYSGWTVSPPASLPAGSPLRRKWRVICFDVGMQVTPQVIFHDVDRSPWVEKYIGERLQRLDRFASGITSCRVTLAQEGASQHKGNRYSVLVEVRVPPQHDLTVRKQKDIHDMHQ